MLQVKRRDQLTFLQSETLEHIPGLVHAFSTRRSERDDFSLGPFDSANPMIQINRARFLAAIGAPGWPIIKLKQIHSGVVVDVEDTKFASEPVSADAAITLSPGIVLGVQTADCVPILVADDSGCAVAAIHAGWRGTAARIAHTTVTRLIQKFGVPADMLRAVIGPHIGVCCYEVGDDVVGEIGDADAFETRPEWLKPHLNLAAANLKQLLEAGVPEERVEVSSLCTKCRADLFHSYRRDGKRMGHLLSIIGMEL